MLSIGLKLSHPSVMQYLPPSCDTSLEMLAHAIRHEKFGVFWPAVMTLCQTNLLFTQRLAVGGAGVLLIRRTVGNVAINDNQCRSLVFIPKGEEGPLEHF